jgi:osmotically-inducible protein OsmY
LHLFPACPDRSAVHAVNVDTRAGDVHLFGVVGRPEARAAAEEHAGQVQRVRSVRNDVRVDPRIDHTVVAVADGPLAVQVRRALAAYAPLEGIPIEVTVAEGVATLRGTVPSDAAHALAAGMQARAVPGVRAAVTTDLRVSDNGTTG